VFGSVDRTGWDKVGLDGSIPLFIVFDPGTRGTKSSTERNIPSRSGMKLPPKFRQIITSHLNDMRLLSWSRGG
jgi:hypothetical protein